MNTQPRERDPLLEERQKTHGSFQTNAIVSQQIKHSFHEYGKYPTENPVYCEALDMMSRRYHEDTTELARRLIVLEFKERTATPEIQKALKEATRLRHIAAIRETLEEEEAGKKAAGVGKPADGESGSGNFCIDDTS